MRIAQLTQAFMNPLLLVLVLLLHITTPALAVHHFGPRPHLRLRGLDQPDDPGDDGCTADTSPETNCNMLNRNSAKQTATNIAQKAAQEAEQAYGTQQCAAAEVALQVKKQLADKAYAAAKAAEAALSGKQQMVEQLESEICESEAALQQDNSSASNCQNNLNAASQSAKQAQQLLLALQSIIKIAQENLAQARNAAAGAQQQVGDKSQCIEAAQHRIQSLKRMLKAARRDLENIKKSAYKAVCAAAEARQKANREARSMIQGKRHRKQQHQ